MLKSLTLLSTLFLSVQASANCDIDPNLLNKACSTEYYAPKNQKQLDEYLQYGKFKDGKLLNLYIKFDLKDKEISIATNCDVKLSRGTSLKASLNGICIKGSSVELKGENKLDSDNKAPVFIASAKSIILRRSFLQTKGEITLTSKIFNPFDGEILISRDSVLKSAKINIFTPSNLIINKDSSLKSSEIVLNGGSCEIGENDDREHDDDRDHGRSCKRFSPKFQYTGKCATNPIPTTIKIASIVNANDSLNVSYSLEGRPANTGARWRFDKEAINIGLTSNKNFLFPGRHLIESIVVDQSGYFRKLGLYQNISPNKFNKGQTAVFQFSGLKRSPPKVTAMMGLRKFILTKSDQDPELFSGEIPPDSAGSKLIAIPEFNYKGSFNLVVLSAISNPDAYIAQSIDQLIALLDSINSANQSYLNSKASLGSLLDELKTKILLLPATDKQKVAEYLQANIFADFHGVTSFKKTQERPTTLFGLLIASAYADDAINNIMLGIVTSLNNFSNTLLRNTPLAIGGALVFGGYIGSKYLPKNYQWLGYVGMAAGAIALVRMASAAQDEIINIHNIDQNSLYLKLPNQVNSDQVATFSVWGQAVPLESIAPASPLISQSINAKNNANFELGRINSQLNSINSTLSLLGFSSQVEPLPLLSFPQTRFPTILSTNYITNVQLLSSEDGQASILSHSKSGNNLLITFKSTKTQSAKLRVTFVNADLGINKNIDTDIVISVAPKAVINYTKNNLTVNFDSTDPEDPNASGLTYSWDFGDGQTAVTNSKTIEHTYSDKKDYTVLLKITDSSGDQVSMSVLVSLVEIEVGIKHVFAGRNVNFTLTDPYIVENTKLNYVWSFGDGETLVTKSKNISHRYPNLNAHQVYVRLVDENNNIINFYSDYLSDRNGSYLSYFVANRGVRYFMESTIQYENIDLRYVWNFGDGNVGESYKNVITHQYANEGSYNVTVTIYDELGALLFRETFVSIVDMSSGSLTAPARMPDGSSGADLIRKELSPTSKIGFSYEYTSSSSGTCYVKDFTIVGETVFAKLYNCTAFDLTE